MPPGDLVQRVKMEPGRHGDDRYGVWPLILVLGLTGQLAEQSPFTTRHLPPLTLLPHDADLVDVNNMSSTHKGAQYEVLTGTKPAECLM